MLIAIIIPSIAVTICCVVKRKPRMGEDNNQVYRNPDVDDRPVNNRPVNNLPANNRPPDILPINNPPPNIPSANIPLANNNLPPNIPPANNLPPNDLSTNNQPNDLSTINPPANHRLHVVNPVYDSQYFNDQVIQNEGAVLFDGNDLNRRSAMNSMR